MEGAVEAVIKGEMGYYRASVQFNVPQTTLERYVKKRRNGLDLPISKTLGSCKPVFTQKQEQEMVSYLKNMEERLFGLTMNECRGLAFQLAELNGIAHPFNKTTRSAGKAWIQGFLSRHPELSIRKPEATSGMRARGFNKVAVSQFFTLLGELVEMHNFSPERIYNVDETGVTVNPKGNSKIIAVKGKRQVGTLTSGERGELVTAEICFSAAGAYMAPMLIYPRKRMQQGFLDGLVPGGWVELNQKGWIDKELFFKWFKKFVEFAKASKDAPVLLLLDGHSSHTKNLELINYARDNGVILLCYPPHTTHRLQALDVSFMKPLSIYYDDEVRKWLRTNPGRIVTFYQLSALFSAAFIRAATMSTAINGFKKTGVWPVDPNVFSDADFLPSATTEIENRERTPEQDTDVPQTKNELNQSEGNPTLFHAVPSTSKVVARFGESTTETEMIILGAGTSKATAPFGERTPEKNTTSIGGEQPGISSSNDSAFSLVPPTAVIPIPQVDPATKRNSRRKGKTAVLTSTPYKKELEESFEKNKSKTPKLKKTKRKIEAIEKSKKNKRKPAIKQVKVSKHRNSSSDSENTCNSDAECLYCGDLYSLSSEGWIACSICLRWAHISCAGIDDEDDEEVLICELCK